MTSLQNITHMKIVVMFASNRVLASLNGQHVIGLLGHASGTAKVLNLQVVARLN